MIIFTLHVKISKFLFRLLATRLKIKLTKCVYPRDFARLFIVILAILSSQREERMANSKGQLTKCRGLTIPLRVNSDTPSRLLLWKVG